MAGKVEFEQPFWQLDRTRAGGLEREQAQRHDLGETDVLGELELAAVPVKVGHLRSVQVVGETIRGEQSLLKAVPVAELDERFGGGEPELEAIPRTPSQVVGQLLALEVHGGQLLVCDAAAWCGPGVNRG